MSVSSWVDDRGVLSHVRDACNRSNPWHVVRVPNRPADVSKHAKQHGRHEHEPVLGLVDSMITLRHPHNCPVAEGPSDKHSQDGSDEATQVR